MTQQQPSKELVDRFFQNSEGAEHMIEQQTVRSRSVRRDEDGFDELAFLEEPIIVEGEDDEHTSPLADEPVGWQFGLRGLMALTLVAGGIVEMWLTESLVVLSLILIALLVLSWRRRGADRVYAMLTYGGGLGVCAGLIISYAGSSSLSFAGLMFASLCSFVALHGALAPLLSALAGLVWRED